MTFDADASADVLVTILTVATFAITRSPSPSVHMAAESTLRNESKMNAQIVESSEKSKSQMPSQSQSQIQRRASANETLALRSIKGQLRTPINVNPWHLRELLLFWSEKANLMRK